MAGNNTKDITLNISAVTQGGDAVAKLTGEIRQLAKQGGDAAPEFERLADEIDKLGAQLAAVDNLAKLTSEMQQLEAVQAGAREEAGRLKAELTGLSAATRSAEAAEAETSASLKETQRAIKEKRIALAELANEYDAAGKKTTDYITKNTDLKAEIIALQREELARQDTLAATKASVQATETAEAALEARYKASARALGAADAAVIAHADALRQTRSALEAQGVATTDLAQAQGTLVSSLKQTADAAERLDLQMKQLRAAALEEAEAAKLRGQIDQGARLLKEIQYAELMEEAVRKLAAAEAAEAQKAREAADAQREYEAAMRAAAAAAEREAQAQREFAAAAEAARRSVQASDYARLFDEQEAALKRVAEAQRQVAAATKRTDDAFKTLGVKNRAAIEGEIAAINAALDTLAGNARVSAADFDKAFLAAQERIGALRREMDGLDPPSQRSGGAMNYLKSEVAGLAAAFGLLEAGRYVVNTINDLESMRRTLVLTTGSTQEAARQIAYLQEVANAAGVSAAEVGKSYSRLYASLTQAGVSSKVAQDVFRSVTLAIGNMGLSSADAEGALRALGQMASKGKVSMEELGQQLGERLPAVLAVTARGLGVTTADLAKLVETGQVLADEQFFAAFGKAVNDTFGNAGKDVEGLRASFARLENAASQAVGTFADAGLVDVLKGALVGLAAVLGPLVLGFSILFDTITTGARQLGVVIAAIVTGDFKNLSGALAQLTDDAVQRQTKLATVLQETIGLRDRSAVSAQAEGQALQAAASGAQANASAQQAAATSAQANAGAQQAAATAATGNSTAQAAAGAAAVAAGAQAAGATGGWLSLTNEYNKAFKLLGDNTLQSEKVVKAKQAEAEATSALAKLQTDETLSRQTLLAAANSVLPAQEKVLGLQQAELALRDEQVKAIRNEMTARGEAGKALEGNLVAAEKERDTIAANVLQMQAEVEQQRNLIAERELAVRSAQDNSAAIGVLKESHLALQNAVFLARAAYDEGNMSLADYTQVVRSAGVAASLYADAQKDATRSAQLRADAVKADAVTLQAKISVERQNLESLAKVADAEGNATQATYYSVEAKRKQIDAVRAAADARVAEANASIDVLQQQAAEITGTDDISAAKRAEIALRIQNERAKITEAQASSAVVRGLEAEITAIQRKAAAQGAATAGQIGKDRTLGGDAAASEADRAKRLSGQNAVDATGVFTLQDKLNKGTLTIDDTQLVAAVSAAAKQNAEVSQNVPAGALSQDFYRSLEMQQNVARRAQEALDGIKASTAAQDTKAANLTAARSTNEANTSTQIANIESQKVQAETAAEQLQARGDVGAAAQQRIQAARLEVEAINARVAAAQRSFELDQQQIALDQQKAAADGLTPAERATLDAQRASAQAKLTQAQAERASVTTVNVNFRGASYVVDTANSSSTNSLVSFLKELESAASGTRG